MAHAQNCHQLANVYSYSWNKQNNNNRKLTVGRTKQCITSLKIGIPSVLQWHHCRCHSPEMVRNPALMSDLPEVRPLQVNHKPPPDTRHTVNAGRQSEDRARSGQWPWVAAIALAVATRSAGNSLSGLQRDKGNSDLCRYCPWGKCPWAHVRHSNVC
jgi:hypothetical protein